MKKKFMGAVLAAAMIVSLTACGKSEENNTSMNTSTVNTEISADQYADTVKANAAVYKNFFELPEYKGISVTVDGKKSISDDDVSEYIDDILKSYSTTETVNEGVTAVGDTITLDYSGLLDGVAFSGGTATEATYTIGSGKFIEDLDKGLAGLTIGKQYDIPCRFPDNYSTSDLAGKDVIFQVTVSSVNKTIIPELTDKWVAENSEALGIDADTVDTLKKEVRKYLEETEEETFKGNKYKAILEVIKSNVNIDNYPTEELDKLVETLKSNVQAEFDSYGSMYGISDLETYLKQVYNFTDMDDFNNYSLEYAKSYLLEKMLLTVIADKEGIIVSADDINDMGKQLADYYGYESYEEILDSYGNEMNSEVGYEVLYEKVSDFLVSNS